MSYDKLLSKSKFFNTKHLITKIEEPIKLNIACGPNIFPYDGWINYDHEDFGAYIQWIKDQKSSDDVNAEYLKALVRWMKLGKELKVNKHNIRDVFPHTNNSVKVIYVGQAIEHFNPFYETPKFLKECHRMLEPGGVLRITTPDLDILIGAYIKGEMHKFASEQPTKYQEMDPSAQLAMIMYGTCAETCRWDHYEGHMFLYTPKSLTTALNLAGFEKVVFYYETGKSQSPILAKEVVDHGMTHSFIIEGIK